MVYLLTVKQWRNSLLILLALLLSAIPQLFVFQPTHASTFTNDRFIDNALFLDAASMSADNIQVFLNSKSGTLKSSSFLMDCDIAGSTAKQMYLSIGAPCGQNTSVARIIYYASQIYGISPKVVMATMQKEQSLVTNPSPTARAYNQAMGFACPDSGGCSSNSNFFYQIDNGTWALRYHYERAAGNNTWWNTKGWVCGSAKNYYKPSLYPRQNVAFYDDNDTHYTTIYLANAATSSMYCYTPHAYNNPQGLYGRPAFGSTGSYYSGSYNFVYYYELWFGSVNAFVYNGLNYSEVFDADYYLNRYSDVKAAFGTNEMAAFSQFINAGMREGRQASANFDVNSYRNRYADLRLNYGMNLPAYYEHFATNGQREGRLATGAITRTDITTLRGVDYSTVYDFTSYKSNNADVASSFPQDDAGAINHFVAYGMNEGRTSKQTFNVGAYRDRYFDLRRSFGDNLKAYYMHYINYGRSEGRVTTGTYVGGTTNANGIDYSSVYTFESYRNSYSDIKSTFGLNDTRALQHFLNYGMNEGRRGSPEFNVYTYKSRYSDLQQVFGNNLKSYYEHYVRYGMAEGRVGN